MLAGRSERSCLSAFKEIGLIGTPESPPVSTLDAKEEYETIRTVTNEAALTVSEGGRSLSSCITYDDPIDLIFSYGDGNVSKL
jgi:hypothetical protein